MTVRTGWIVCHSPWFSRRDSSIGNKHSFSSFECLHVHVMIATRHQQKNHLSPFWWSFFECLDVLNLVFLWMHIYYMFSKVGKLWVTAEDAQMLLIVGFILAWAFGNYLYLVNFRIGSCKVFVCFFFLRIFFIIRIHLVVWLIFFFILISRRRSFAILITAKQFFWYLKGVILFGLIITQKT